MPFHLLAIYVSSLERCLFLKKKKKKRVALLFVFAIELYELFTLWDSAAAAAAKSRQSCPAPYQIHDLQIFSPVL